MPQQLPFIDEAVGADSLTLAKIFEGVVGVQRLLPHLELLSIAGGVEPLGGASVKRALRLPGAMISANGTECRCGRNCCRGSSGPSSCFGVAILNRPSAV